MQPLVLYISHSQLIFNPKKYFKYWVINQINLGSIGQIPLTMVVIRKDAPLIDVVKIPPRLIIYDSPPVLDIEPGKHHNMGDYSAADQGTYSNVQRNSRPWLRMEVLQGQQQGCTSYSCGQISPTSIIGHNSLVLDMELCRHYKMGDYSAAPQGTYSNFRRSSRPQVRLSDLQEQQQVFHYRWSIFPNGKQNWQFFPLLSSLLTCLSMYSIPTLHRMTYSFKNKVVLVAMHC